MVHPMLIIWQISIVFFTIGLFTRKATIVNYLFTVLFMGFTFQFAGQGNEFNYHIDKEFIPVAFLLMFMPISRRLSFDNLIEKIKYSNTKREYNPKTTVSSLNYIILIIQILQAYKNIEINIEETMDYYMKVANTSGADKPHSFL